VVDKKTGERHSYGRFFHTESSISDYTTEAGFKVRHIESYDEHLFIDFMRTEPSPETDNIIELLAEKE